MSYHFIFMFLATFTEKYLFLKLMYRAINQKEFKQKLLRFPLQCHLERDLKLILQDIYQKNIELEVTDHKFTQQGFLKGMVSSIKDNVIFNLPPIKEEEKWQCYESPLAKYVHPKFCLNLIDPRHPQK